MAVRALCRAFRAQPRDLAVERIEERFGLFRVAAAALFHHSRAESRHAGTPDCVRRVAVVAGREIHTGLRLAGRMDALLEYLLDAVVALATGAREVCGIDGGVRIIRRKLAMRRVAVDARGGDH